MSDWKCTGECRWLQKDSPEIFQVTLILQQLWQRAIAAPYPMGHISHYETEWRDVPTVNKEDI